MNISNVVCPELAVASASEAMFRPYGHIIEVGSRPMSVNNGTAFRHDVGDVLTSGRAASDLYLSVFEVEAQRLPLRLDMLECHPCSAQTIVPMRVERYLAVVSLSGSDGRPAMDSLRAFVFGPTQGVNYNPGVWHAPIIALRRKSLFFVQSWQDGSESDCLEVGIDPILLTEDDVQDIGRRGK